MRFLRPFHLAGRLQIRRRDPGASPFLPDCLAASRYKASMVLLSHSCAILVLNGGPASRARNGHVSFAAGSLLGRSSNVLSNFLLRRRGRRAAGHCRATPWEPDRQQTVLRWRRGLSPVLANQGVQEVPGLDVSGTTPPRTAEGEENNAPRPGGVALEHRFIIAPVSNRFICNESIHLQHVLSPSVRRTGSSRQR